MQSWFTPNCNRSCIANACISRRWSSERHGIDQRLALRDNRIMTTPLRYLSIVIVFLCGCHHAQFIYNTPPARLNPSGPSVAVLSIKDSRTNREIDKVMVENYLTDIQRAFASELAGLNAFQFVSVCTNDAPSTADVRVIPEIKRLEWNMPNQSDIQRN